MATIYIKKINIIIGSKVTLKFDVPKYIKLTNI